MISISLFFTFCERFLKLRYNNVNLVTSELSNLNEDRTLGRTNAVRPIVLTMSTVYDFDISP